MAKATKGQELAGILGSAGRYRYMSHDLLRYFLAFGLKKFGLGEEDRFPDDLSQEMDGIFEAYAEMVKAGPFEDILGPMYEDFASQGSKQYLGQFFTPQHMALMTALAVEPTESPFSAPYMGKHALGSIGGVQTALKRLTELDYVEKQDGVYILVDPVFSIWLRHLKS
jgi:hypothetical protein